MARSRPPSRADHPAAAAELGDDVAFAGHGHVVDAAAAPGHPFLRPTGPGDVLTAYAVERVTRGRSGIYDVTVTCEGDVVAEFRGRSRVIREGGPA